MVLDLLRKLMVLAQPGVIQRFHSPYLDIHGDCFVPQFFCGCRKSQHQNIVWHYENVCISACRRFGGTHGHTISKTLVWREWSAASSTSRQILFSCMHRACFLDTTLTINGVIKTSPVFVPRLCLHWRLIWLCMFPATIWNGLQNNCQRGAMKRFKQEKSLSNGVAV